MSVITGLLAAAAVWLAMWAALCRATGVYVSVWGTPFVYAAIGLSGSLGARHSEQRRGREHIQEFLLATMVLALLLSPVAYQFLPEIQIALAMVWAAIGVMLAVRSGDKSRYALAWYGLALGLGAVGMTMAVAGAAALPVAKTLAWVGYAAMTAILLEPVLTNRYLTFLLWRDRRRHMRILGRAA